MTQAVTLSSPLDTLWLFTVAPGNWMGVFRNRSCLDPANTILWANAGLMLAKMSLVCWEESKHLPNGHTTLLRRWINVSDVDSLLGTRRCCNVESTVDSTSQQRRVPNGLSNAVSTHGKRRTGRTSQKYWLFGWCDVRLAVQMAWSHYFHLRVWAMISPCWPRSALHVVLHVMAANVSLSGSNLMFGGHVQVLDFQVTSRSLLCGLRHYICWWTKGSSTPPPPHTSAHISCIPATQNICIAFVQRRPNVFDVGPTLYKCYTNVLCLLV